MWSIAVPMRLWVCHKSFLGTKSGEKIGTKICVQGAMGPGSVAFCRFLQLLQLHKVQLEVKL